MVLFKKELFYNIRFFATLCHKYTEKFNMFEYIKLDFIIEIWLKIRLINNF